jgi:hypothetical protein
MSCRKNRFGTLFLMRHHLSDVPLHEHLSLICHDDVCHHRRSLHDHLAPPGLARSQYWSLFMSHTLRRQILSALLPPVNRPRSAHNALSSPTFMKRTSPAWM